METNSNNDVIQKGRKKVYAVKEKLELLLPNGENDGILDKDDLVYVVQKYRANGKDAYRFRVMKFAETKNGHTIYSAEQTFFKPYFDKTSNADGNTSVDNEKVKQNYTVPAITGLGAGVLGYMFATKYQKNKMMFAIGGIAIGVAFGIYLTKQKDK